MKLKHLVLIPVLFSVSILISGLCAGLNINAVSNENENSELCQFFFAVGLAATGPPQSQDELPISERELCLRHQDETHQTVQQSRGPF